MKPRIAAHMSDAFTMQAMLDLQAKVEKSGLEHSLIELIKIRASQLNGCAYCLHMHTRDARKAGETEERLYMLSAWRESPLYTERERAALAWTDALTLLPETGAPDEDYELMTAQFNGQEQARLTLAIVTINAWNRFGVGFRRVHPVGKTAGASVSADAAKAHVA